MDVEKRLKELGWTLPPPPKPVAAYIPCVRAGKLLFVSGQLPWKDGQLTAVGKVPSAISIETARSAAAQCAVCALAVVGGELAGDWEKLVRIVRVGAFVQSDDDFTAQPKVADGASDLLQEVLGESGRHARAAVGVNALPLGASVEVELLVELRG
jgi:enamine deaminase RidA (YjgF/YER057c/UK114 family)